MSGTCPTNPQVFQQLSNTLPNGPIELQERLVGAPKPITQAFVQGCHGHGLRQGSGELPEGGIELSVLR
jgi:hypothetical protein